MIHANQFDARHLLRLELSAQPLSTKCCEHGLVASTAGTFNNVLRILAPLVVTDAQFDEGLAILEAAFASVAERSTHAALSRA